MFGCFFFRLIVCMCNQLCAGLQHMHNFDPPYAHNDVKPGNVLLTSRKDKPPLAVLMDFGSTTPAIRRINSRSEALRMQVKIDGQMYVLGKFKSSHTSS